MKTLSPVHTSPETAFLVADYPYGFRLRCKIRYWTEENKKGIRFCSQTTNPKMWDEVWNKPKASTYSEFGAMYLDENGHVQWATLNEYSELAEMIAFRITHGSGISEAATKKLNYIIALKEAFENEKAARGNPAYGTTEYAEAFKAAKGSVKL